MRKSQKLQLKLSEARQRLNKAIEKRNALPAGQSPDADLLKELEEATSAIEPLEIEYRASVVQEDTEDQEARRNATDAEGLERRRLLGEVSILPFLREAAGGDAVAGRELEVRQMLLGDEARSNRLPIEILEQRRPSPVSRSRGLAATRTQMETEMRADSATALAAGATADGGQAPVLERVFSQSIAARLLVGMPMVTIGSHNFPVMLTGATAAQQAQGGRQDAQQATFTGFTLDPVRLTARYLFAIEDVYKMADFEDVLRRDLAATISDRMDYQIVNGDGNAPNVNGFLNELAAPANPGAKTDFTSYAASYTTKVDGLNAYNLSDIRAVIGAKTYEFAETLTNTQRDMTAQEYMEFRTGGISVSNRVPAPSSDIQTNILALTSYPGMNAVAPIWSSLELIRDPYTNAAEGQIALTAIMLWNFKIVRETGFGLFKTKVA